jgi:hypothetical protein
MHCQSALAEYQLLQVLDRGKKINAVGNVVSGFLLLGLFQDVGVFRDQSLTGFMSMFHRLCVPAIMPTAVSSPAECILSLPHMF